MIVDRSWRKALVAVSLVACWTLAAAADYGEEVLADNPIGYWRLAESDPDAPAADESGNDRPMTYNNFSADLLRFPGPDITQTLSAPSFVTDVQNTISAGDPMDFAFEPGQSFSYDFFIKTAPSASPNQVGVVVKGYTTQNQVAPWYLSRVEEADGATEFFTRTTDLVSQQANGTINVSDEQWHHVAAVYDAEAAENRIYVDGVLDATKTDVPEDSYGANSEVLTLGTHFDRFFTGQLAEFAIYDQALTEERIQAHFNAVVFEPDLVGDFNFDGQIDTADFGVMLQHFNEGTFYAQGDINLDLSIDLHDFVQFRELAGAAGAATASVPEPTGGLTALVATAALVAIRRRRRATRRS